MGDGADSLPMTVHLLANSGRSALLQQSLDRLLGRICPGIPLFLVSERATPLKYYESYRKRSSGFPGMSVLLFLREDLGAERVSQVHDILQHPPWRYQCLQVSPGQSPYYGPAREDFYSLGEQLPVWGVRRAGGGAEALRVTLYCGFENHEDAVRLYETIARRAAAPRGSGLCVLALRAPDGLGLQLGLQRLPPGVAARPCASSLLQFSVRDMGQLVPLLPHPCVPISSSRWQTQDYEGNTVLLQFQGNSKHGEKSDGFSNQQRKSALGSLLREPIPVPFPMELAGAERRSQTPRAMPGDWRAVPAIPVLRCPACPRHGASAGGREAETDVDTGCAVGSAAGARSPRSRFRRDLRSSLLQPPAPGAGPGVTSSSWDRARLSPSAAGRDGGAARRASGFHSQPSRASPGNGTEEEEEEEFFI